MQYEAPYYYLKENFRALKEEWDYAVAFQKATVRNLSTDEVIIYLFIPPNFILGEE